MLNKRNNKAIESYYPIEEKVTLTKGKWEGLLKHDYLVDDSLIIYTGEGLTGSLVRDYFVSTPSDRPWKTSLELFSDSPHAYINYLSKGDQVDADDINKIQDKIGEMDNETFNYREENDVNISDLQESTSALRTNKADKTYVDTELINKYNKEDVYTKEEVLQKVKDIIGTAPDALNTLGKLADALDNDPNFATTIVNLLATKVDKSEGKGLSDESFTIAEKNKLAGVEDGANKYNHPETHTANMIVESTIRRFVSDEEKISWDDKWNYNEDTIRAVKVDIAGAADTLVGPITWNKLGGE